MSPTEALGAANQALADARPFAAHEILEEMWKQRPAGERNFWRGLTQFAVALTHLQRDNEKGAAALFERAADLLQKAGTHHGVDGATLGAQATELAAATRDQAARLRASAAEVRFSKKR